MTTGKSRFDIIQEQLDKLKAEVKNLEQTPKELKAVTNRVNELQSIKESVKDNEVVMKDLTERVGKFSGGTTKKGEDWKPYAIIVLAIGFVALLYLSMTVNSNMQVTKSDITKWQQQVQTQIDKIK